MRTSQIDKAQVIAASLPNHASTYTVISHQDVINEVYKKAEENNFKITDEKYFGSKDCSVVTGVYTLDKEGYKDEDVSLSFVWTNSYDKSVRFKSSIAGAILKSDSVLIMPHNISWVRKHTGTADVEMRDNIDSQFNNSRQAYDMMLKHIKIMKHLSLNQDQLSILAGDMLIYFNLLSIEQISKFASEVKKPSYAYSNDRSLWTIYNHLMVAIKGCHPKGMMDLHKNLHSYIETQFKFSNYYSVETQKLFGVSVQEEPEIISKEEVFENTESVTFEEETQEIIPVVENENLEESITEDKSEMTQESNTEIKENVFDLEIEEETEIEEPEVEIASQADNLDETVEEELPAEDIEAYENAIREVISKEIFEIYGEIMVFDYEEDGENYTVRLDDGSDLSLLKELIQLQVSELLK
jgi:hypothetical protein